jgi:hypothetical protein
MMGIQESLSTFFPNMWIISLAIGWVGASVLISLLFNGQEVYNKRMNAVKSVAAATFCATWGEALLLNSGRPFNMSLIVFLYSGSLMYIVGDFIGFAIDRSVHSPGGVRGIFWRWCSLRLQSMASTCGANALHALRPTERRMYDAVKQEKDRQIAEVVVKVPMSMTITADSTIPEPNNAAT